MKRFNVPINFGTNNSVFNQTLGGIYSTQSRLNIATCPRKSSPNKATNSCFFWNIIACRFYPECVFTVRVMRQPKVGGTPRSKSQSQGGKANSHSFNPMQTRYCTTSISFHVSCAEVSFRYIGMEFRIKHGKRQRKGLQKWQPLKDTAGLETNAGNTKGRKECCGFFSQCSNGSQTGVT